MPRGACGVLAVGQPLGTAFGLNAWLPRVASSSGWRS